MPSPIAYLTCELKGRDFDSRLLIAAELLKLGYYVVVGQYWGLIFSAQTAPRGCYLFKTANSIQVQAMHKCAALGHRVVAADEEALPWTPALTPAITDAGTFDYCDAFMALNEGHKQALLQAFPKAKGKIVVAGTARMDVLRKTRTARPQGAPYILFNTGFGFINGLWGDLEKAKQIYVAGSNLDLTVESHRRQIEDRFAYEEASLGETVALIDALLRKTGTGIVIRPHPSERAEYWEKKYASHPRVSVVKQSDPLTWIQHAQLVIHSDSATGLEAAMFGVPCLNLSPRDAWAERLIIRDANVTVANAVQAAETVVQFLRGDTPLQRKQTQDLFPAHAAKATARAIKALLPKPGAMSGITWDRLNRSALQREKFSVSEDEARAAVQRVFPMAGVGPKPMVVLDDSVFALSPD